MPAINSFEKTTFSDCLVENNDLRKAGFEQWVFFPGMLFKSMEKWWGQAGLRNRPHEGLDLCFYRNRARQTLRLTTTTKVPAMFEGEIVNINDDFLGKSIYVRHRIYDARNRQLYTIYAHVKPYDGVACGSMVSKTTIIATIADAAKKNKQMLPHIHLSMAWLPKQFPCDRLTWETMSDAGVVTLWDPLEVIVCRYTTVPFNPVTLPGDLENPD